jgi:hypothetical protein
VLLIDDSNNPVHALNFAKYIVKKTSNQAFILLLSSDEKSTLPKKKRKRTDSESEKRLDFDEDMKSKSLVKLEQFVNSYPNSLFLISQIEDKNYIESFEEAAKAFTGSGGFECAIDLR